MSRSTLRLAVAPIAAALALVIAACGGSDKPGAGSGTSGSSTGGGAAQETGGKQGGLLKQLGSSDVDYLDPGHTYFTAGYQVAYVTQRPLYSFKPGQAVPVPDLAASKPEISSDLKTITVKIKPNVKFSPPVNRAVTS